MGARNLEKRRKIRALEATRDKVAMDMQKLKERAKVVRTQLKHERGSR